MFYRFGDRKPPASAYAGDSPILCFDTDEGGWFGGMFWDGCATGATLAMLPRPQVDNIVACLKTLPDGYFQR